MPKQLDLFDTPKRPPKFHGADYQPKRDQARLADQLQLIWDAMIDGGWRSVEEIQAITGILKATSISAQLRNLRKPENGGHTVNRRHEGNGQYRFQLVPNKDANP